MSPLKTFVLKRCFTGFNFRGKFCFQKFVKKFKGRKVRAPQYMKKNFKVVIEEENFKIYVLDGKKLKS